MHSNELIASGALWSSYGASKVFASYGAMIGNIGVKGPAWFVYNNPISMKYGLFGPDISTQNGIDFYQPFAGKSKDLFNPFRKPSEEEIQNIQNTLNSIYEDFINIVSKHRKIKKDYIKNNIGALLFDSNNAKNYNLIDDVLDLNGTLDEMLKLLDIEDDYQFIKIKNKINYFKEMKILSSKFFVNDNYYIKNDICNLINYQILLISQYKVTGCKN